MSDQKEGIGAGDGSPQFDRKQAIKLAVEFGPLLVFFIGNSRYGIFAGTAAFMVATVVALIVSRTVLGRIATMPLITGVFVLVFGGLTLWLQDDHFIKIKPTIVNGLFAAILFGGLASWTVVSQDRLRRRDASFGRGLARPDVALGLVLRVPRVSQRGCLEKFFNGYVGRVQSFRNYADHVRVCAGADRPFEEARDFDFRSKGNVPSLRTHRRR